MDTGPVRRRLANGQLRTITMGSIVASALGLGLIAPAPSAFAATAAVVVLSSSSYGPQSDGFLYIVGEVQNTGTGPITGIDVSIGLYNSAGTILATDDVPTQVSVLGAGERSGFVDIVPPPGGYASYKVLGATAMDSAAAPYHRFAISNARDVVDANGVHDIAGVVTNAGYYAAQNVTVYFTFYNEAGTVVDVDTQPVSLGALGIAASAPFDERNVPAALHYTTFAILVEGSVNAPACGPCVPFTRIAGATRIETAVAASQDQFPTPGSAGAVVLARSDAFPDALAGGPLAAHMHGPLLITGPSALDPVTQTEIERVAPAGSTVYLLGGSAALNPSIDTALTAAGYKTVRVSGANRFSTAVAIAQALGNPGVIFEATGTNFPDALSGGPAAIVKGAAILLTNGASQAAETAAYLALHGGAARYALGGPAAAADSQATPLVGADRYATSAAIAKSFFAAPTLLGVSTSVTFPDALSAGPDLGAQNAPLLLVPPASPLSGAYATYLVTVAKNVIAVHVFGGTAAVGTDIVTEMQDALFSASTM